MPEDLYADATMPASAPEEKSSQSQTTTIPKSILGDRECKPGEKLTFEVQKVGEDSVVVSFDRYSGEEETEPEIPTEAPPPAAPPGGGMAGMMQ